MKKYEIEINGVKYVPKSSIKNVSVKASSMKGKPYRLIRTENAGVFAGYLDKRVGKEAKLLCARRIWYWSGANSLSQLAVDGTNDPDSCKFAVPVDVELTEVIEVLTVSKKAQESILGVKEWRK